MADKLLIDAIAYALSRDVVPSDDYYNRMSGIQRRQAVSIAGLSEVEHVRYVMAQVNSALASGQTFEQFQKSVNLVDIDLPRSRLYTIYHTNIYTAYSHGRWHSQQRDKANKPYLMYDAMNDSITRPVHRGFDNTIRHIDDPWWRGHTPALGYNCRCKTRALTKEEAEARGITTDADLPTSGADSSGFGHTPDQYTERFTQLINDRISQTMLENVKQSSTIAKIGGKITSAIGNFLKKPTTKLAALIAAAKKLLEGDSDE